MVKRRVNEVCYSTDYGYGLVMRKLHFVFAEMNLHLVLKMNSILGECKGFFDSLHKNRFLVFKNLKLKNLIGNLILQKCFQNLFFVYQFLKLKK
jgi:hypothetical protein